MYERLKRKIQPLINIYHLVRAAAACVWFGYPSRKIKIIGVTGTDGKTTTSHLLYHTLQRLGKKVSIISTVYAKIGQKEYETGLHTTTPDAAFVQKLIAQAVKEGDEYLVLETTSHSLDQHRVYGIRFEAGIITNITPEHLDYHKTYLRYLKAKSKLLLASEHSIINRDDKSYLPLVEILKKNRRKFQTYGRSKKADIRKDFGRIYPGITDYNVYNYTAAYAALSILGFDEDDVIAAMKGFVLPVGRMETVYNKGFTVIIDFAHTPNSIRNLLQALGKQKKGRIIHVFGSAGLRDAAKRPAMGYESSQAADVMIITEEDYRTEDPSRIAMEIASGIQNSKFKIQNADELDKNSRDVYSIIPDRQKAIETAVRIAAPGDIVVTTGKSHERSLCRGRKEYPWSEHEAIQTALTHL